MGGDKHQFVCCIRYQFFEILRRLLAYDTIPTPSVGGICCSAVANKRSLELGSWGSGFVVPLDSLIIQSICSIYCTLVLIAKPLPSSSDRVLATVLRQTYQTKYTRRQSVSV